MSNVNLISVDTLQQFIQDVFQSVGVPCDDSKTASEVLIASDLRGIESHGIGRLKYYYDRFKSGQHKPITKMDIIRESPTTAVIDGNHGVGMVIATRSMQMAIDKARIYGMGSVAVRNSTHFGIDGYYAMMAVKANMIGMSFTNARPSIAPTFGVQPMLGTNPIAFGCPTDEEFPFLFDAATSITQRGKFEVLARAEQSGSSGWVVNQNGENVTDANIVLNGLDNKSCALLPLGGAGETLGGHKGYGLATIVEILSASLQTGAFLNGLLGIDNYGRKGPFRIGHFFMVINIESFVDLNIFRTTTGQILRDLRNSQHSPGCGRIYTAGEKEFENEIKVRSLGISVNPNLKKELKYIQNDLNLTQYNF
jgi:L-2-hydroxycarboxylate dehydrogenase (NAD+)